MNFSELFSYLISQKTISKSSNKKLMIFIGNLLSKKGIEFKLLEGSPEQYNLYAIIGPKTDGGILLSGHTDVVPTDGQNWFTDPYKLVLKKNKYFGRGTCDMKGFIAIALELIAKIKPNDLKKPLHLVLSYDEEIGCVGIQKLVPFLKKLNPKPSFCIVGEPTGMKLVNQHKGKKNYLVEFHGVEAHSSLVDNGVNAITYCSEFIQYLEVLQKNVLNDRKRKNEKFSPPYSTINVGVINGGIALNIIPKFCRVEFEIRDLPGEQINTIIKGINSFIKSLEKRMKQKNKDCYINFLNNNNFPPLQTNNNKKIIGMALKKLKTNSVNSVSFGTEAGVFNQLGIETIVCGPGNIEQAHKPNEFLEKSQIEKCRKFLDNILQYLYK